MRSNRIILIFIFFIIGYFLYYRDKQGPLGSFFHTLFSADAAPKNNPYKSPEPDTIASATKGGAKVYDDVATATNNNSKITNSSATATHTAPKSSADEPSLLDKIKGTVLGNTTTQETTDNGIPDFALPAIHKGDDIVKHKNYILSYDDDAKCPAWVAHKLRGEYTQGRASRAMMEFVPDKGVSGNTALSSDYNSSGYDRGHMVPAGDFKCCSDLMNETFYMSNVCPQNPDLNRYLWENLESRIRGWSVRDEELYVVTGPVLKDGLAKIGRYNRVSVPEYFFKIVLFYQPNSGKPPRGIAFLVPNQSLMGERVTKFVVPIDEVERVTGIDFFAKLPAAIQAQVEATSSWKAWTEIQ